MRRCRTIAALVATLATGACTSFETPGGALVAEVDAPDATIALQRINERAHECWIGSGDRHFRGLALIPEIDTHAGDPRILIVEHGNAAGLPQLVITAEGQPVRLATYGPLADRRISGRINGDVMAWAAGRRECR